MHIERRCTRADNARTHGRSATPLYGIWETIKSRCFNPRYKDWKHYGGRGISMCTEWRLSFSDFRRYVGDPPFPGATLDRIKNDEDYKPGNVRWATRKEQSRNTRRTRFLTHPDGRVKSIPAWADELGVTIPAIFARLRTGMSEAETLTIPFRKNSRRERKALNT